MTIVLDKKADGRSKPTKKRNFGMFSEHVSIDPYRHKKLKISEIPIPPPY